MGILDNRIILEPEDYTNERGFLFLKGVQRISMMMPAPPKAPVGFQIRYYYECLLCGEELPPEDVMNHNHDKCHDEEMEQEAKSQSIVPDDTKKE